MKKNFFIGETDFRIWLPNVVFIEKSEDAYNSRRIAGVMSTDRKDRQGEVVIAKGLDFADFLSHGHFNDNHSQETSAIVGYPETVKYHKDLDQYDSALKGREGWTAEGYILKGTRRADAIWELAKALSEVPNRKLGFSIEGKVVRREDKTIEKAKIRNVAITNCFPGDTKVVGAANKVTRRMYSGEMIEIHLATGEKLTGTPNHPIFTQRGWMALGELDEVNDRIGRFDSDLAKTASFPQVSHDANNIPSTLKQIFDASLVSGDSFWINKARKSDFHGDGAGGDVDVVLAKGFLRDGLKSIFDQKFGKKAFSAADKQLPGFFGLGLGLQFCKTGFFAFARLARGLCKPSFLLASESGIFQPVCFLDGSSYPEATGRIENSLPTEAVFGGDKGTALSPSIGFGKLSLKRRFNFNGHVFNLDTTHGWYGANGIVAHNCPVNTDCGWDVLVKSFSDSHEAQKAMMAGYGVSPSTQDGGGAVRAESLDSDAKEIMDRKKKRKEALKRAIDFDGMLKAMEFVLESRSDFDEEAAATLVNHLFKKEGR